jgi:DNA-binding response OmpR family regulator
MNILIVEDDKETLDVLAFSFKEKGFVVDVATDGEAGSYKSRINNYDLIILDNMLPYKTGRQICSEIRNSGNSVPIIMLSVKSEIDTKVDLFNLGIDDYIVKPFSFSELLARAKALLRRPQKIENDILCIEDIFLDAKKHTVTQLNKEIHLTPKEFSLLEYLTRNRGKVLSRREILEHVWDLNANLFTNTVETHIANLRKKLKQKSQNEFIHTISGAGYKIN